MTNEAIDKFDKAMKQLEKDIESGKFEKYLKKISEERKKKEQYVNNKKYFEWLVSFLKKWEDLEETYETERFLYIDKEPFTKQDIKNEKYIGSPIFDLFDKIGAEQGLSVTEDNSWSFPSFEWNFKFDNQIYFICEIIGQGTEFIIRKENKEVKDFLDLDKYFSK